MTQRQVRFAFFGVLAALALAGLDGAAVAPALPQIVSQLHGFDRVSWVVTSYLLASTVTIPLYGKLSDLYGRRNLFAVAIVVFTVGSILCAASQTMAQLVVSRGIQGIGAGGLVPLAIATIGDLYAPRQRGRIQGYTGGLFAVTSLAGPLLGGILTDQASWRWIFLLNVPVGAAALGIVLVAMRLPRAPRTPHLDVLGFATMLVGSTCILLALVWGGNQYPWGSTQVVALAAVGTAMTALFVAAERRAREPIIPLWLFRRRVFAVAMVSGPLIGASMMVVTVYIPIYVQQVLGSSATGSGVVLIPYMLGWVASSIVVGRIVSRTGRYKIFPIVGSVIAATGLLLVSQLGPHTSRPHLVLVMVVLGIGTGPMFQTFTVAVQNAVAATEIGASTAALQFMRSIGGALGLAAFAAVLTGRLTRELAARLGPGAVDAKRLLEPGSAALRPGVATGARAALGAALDHAYLWCVPVMALTVVCSLLLPEVPLHTRAPHERIGEAPLDLAEAD